MKPGTQLRLEQLESNIDTALRLLNQYEELLASETEPARRLGYERQVARMRESASAFEHEKQALAKEPQAIQYQPVFLEISKKLDELRDEQRTRDQALLAAIFERLDEQSEQTVRAVLAAADTNQIAAEESRELVSAVEQHLAQIAANGTGTAAVSATAQVAEAIKDPALDSSHKLKLSIPIVPLLLSYEAEIGIASGVNLKRLWDKVVAKTRGKQ